jgi:hypothetical protein
MQSCHSKSEQHDATSYDENSSPESEVVTLDSPQPSTSSASTQTPFEHSLKIINPSRMSEFTRVNIRGKKHCCTLEEVKKLITDNFPHGENLPDMDTVEMGYIEPGHGSKGKKCWLYTDTDVAQMYDEHRQKTRKVLLWCYSHAKKSGKKSKAESTSQSGSTRRSKYEPQSEKMTEVDKIYSKLQEEHKTGYSPEQLRAWAHLLQMGKHDSYTQPPDKPFFRGRKRAAAVCTSALESIPETKKSAASPGRRVSMRSELIDQLKKWHQLFESGAIGKEEHDELQKTILLDIKQV